MSCKTINIDLTNVPPVPIQIGVAGENSFRTITFDASKWGADYPDATYTVVYRRSDGYLYPVLVNASADAIVWNPTGTDTAVSGNGQLEVRLLDGETIGKTIIMQTYVAPSLIGDESEPSTPAPDWVNDVADDADRAEAAVTHYPQIRGGYWWVWNVESGEWVNTGVKATGEGGGAAAVIVTIDDTTDPPMASMTAAEIKAAVDRGERVAARYSGVDLHYIAYIDNTAIFAVLVDFDHTTTAATIMIAASGAATIDATPLAAYDDIPTPQEMANAAPVQSVNGMTGNVTIPTGNPDAVLYTPQTLTPAQQEQARENIGAGTYSKPSGGIPASDLASGVIPSVPQMATDPNMSDWTSGKTVDAAAMKTDLEMFHGVLIDIYGVLDHKASVSDIPTAVSELTNDSGYQTAQQVQTAIAAIPDELPAVTASDNGKFLRVVNGAWAAETVSTWQGGSY